MDKPKLSAAKVGSRPELECHRAKCQSQTKGTLNRRLQRDAGGCSGAVHRGGDKGTDTKSEI
jgi:hypothetical protein